MRGSRLLSRLLALFSLLLPQASAACTPTVELWGKVRKYASAFGLDPYLVYVVVWRESRFCPRALGRDGEVGLGQVKPSTALFLGVPPQYLWDIDWNLYATAKYLRYLYDRFGSWPKALAAYNAGPARVAKGDIPEATQRYVRVVLTAYAEGRKRLGAP